MLGPIEAAHLEELRKANRHSSALGQQVLYLARRMDDAAAEGGASVSALNKELRATVVEAMQSADKPVSRLAGLRAVAGG